MEKLDVANICFYTTVIKVPDDGSDEPKHVTHCVTLKCCACILRLYFNTV
jgi:hypothetical protein